MEHTSISSGGHSALQKRRQERGLSELQLAAATSLSVTQIKNLESGRHTPNLRTARRLATALETTVDALFPVQPDPDSPVKEPIFFGDAA